MPGTHVERYVMNNGTERYELLMDTVLLLACHRQPKTGYGNNPNRKYDMFSIIVNGKTVTEIPYSVTIDRSRGNRHGALISDGGRKIYNIYCMLKWQYDDAFEISMTDAVAQHALNTAPLQKQAYDFLGRFFSYQKQNTR